MIDIGTDEVIGVLLADGWHKVRSLDFDTEPVISRSLDDGHCTLIDIDPAFDPAFDFTTTDGRRLIGPASSIVALELVSDAPDEVQCDEDQRWKARATMRKQRQ